MFFFGFLSSTLPYLATFVVMGLYILIGNPTKEDFSLSESSIQISVHQEKSSLSTDAATYSFNKKQSIISTPLCFVANTIRSRKIYSHISHLYSTTFCSQQHNKAPPVLA